MRPRRAVYTIAIAIVGSALSALIICKLHRPRLDIFRPPTGKLFVGFREAETHRPKPAPIPSANYNIMQNAVTVLLHVDATGRVFEVQPGDDDTTTAELNAVRSTALTTRYTPFLQHNQPTGAWVQEAFYLTPKPNLPLIPVPFPYIPNPAAVNISLTRTACLGTCPAYSLEITGDGLVTYRGDYFVSIPGTHTAHIPPATVQSLVDRFRADSFFSFRDKYIENVTDGSTFTLSFSSGDNRTKTITDYGGLGVGMPSVVRELEDAVDTAADSARWITASPQTLAAMRDANILPDTPAASLILRRAVVAGDVTTVRTLLALHVVTSIKTPPDQERFSFDDLPLLLLALDQCPSPGVFPMLDTILASPNSGTTPTVIQQALGEVAAGGALELAHRFIALGADPNQRFNVLRDQDNQTFLMLAVTSGHWAMIEDALARPHDFSAVDANGNTALDLVFRNAPMHENVTALADLLASAGAPTQNLDRAISSTCELSSLQWLVAHGANINGRNADGETALFAACSVAGVQFLLDHGIDPTLRNKHGQDILRADYVGFTLTSDPRAALVRGFLAAHRH